MNNDIYSVHTCGSGWIKENKSRPKEDKKTQNIIIISISCLSMVHRVIHYS